MCHWKLSYPFYAIIYNFSSLTCHYRQSSLTDLLKAIGKRQYYPPPKQISIPHRRFLQAPLPSQSQTAPRRRHGHLRPRRRLVSARAEAADGARTQGRPCGGEGPHHGVGFRDWTASTAESLGLAGWVCNRPTAAWRRSSPATPPRSRT